jgi:outer membrane protein, heavy metal efflux system
MRTTAFVTTCLVAGWCLAAPGRAQEPDVPQRLSLGDALRLVQSRHPALATARDRVAAAEAAARAANQRPNPTFKLSSEGSRPWSADGRSFDTQELLLSVEQEFETGGRRGLRTAVAAAGATVAGATLDDEWRRLRLETATAYFALVLGRLEADSARTALAEVDTVIAVNRARYRQGEVSGVELRRLEVERMKFSDDVLAAELAERNARATLLSLLGAARLDAPLEPSEGFGSLAPQVGTTGAGGADIDIRAAIATALARRPEIVAARGEQQRASSDFELQRAIRLPNVTFGAGYRRDFGQNGLAITATIPLPLFDRNAGGIARADAERRAAGGQVQLVERRVSLEVQLAVNGLSALRARLASIESSYLQKAKEARDSALAAYRSGATDLIDYLDAQRSYRDVQRAYQRAQFDVRMALIQLDTASAVIPGDPRP